VLRVQSGLESSGTAGRRAREVGRSATARSVGLHFEDGAAALRGVQEARQAALERDWQQPGHVRGSGRRCTAHKRCPQADRTAAPPTRSSPARRLPPQHPEQNVRCRARQNFSETYCPCIEVVVSETALAIFTNVRYIKRYRQPHSNAARPIVTSQHATQKTNATSRRCPHPPLPRGHLMVGVAARTALKWWYQYTHHAAGSSPLWGVGVLHAACTGRAAKRESSRSPSRSTRAVVGRRSVGARGGDAHDGAAALRRVRDVRAAARGRGRQRRGRALGNGDAVRRRVPFMSRLAARQAGGAGRGAENIFVLGHTHERTHKNPEVGSFSLTSFL
jgi:hypothetical protein